MFKKSIAIAISLVLVGTASATGHKPVLPSPKEPVPTPSPSSEADAIAALRAELRNTQAQVAMSRSGAASQAASNSAAESTSNATTGNNSVDVEGDSSTYRAKALALSLPGLVAAPAVPGQCLEHHAGWGVASAGRTGFTRFAEKCLAQVQCLARADRYFAWGEKELALAQLSACGGVSSEDRERQVAKWEARVQMESADSVSHSELAQTETKLRDEMNEKLSRIHKRNMEK